MTTVNSKSPRPRKSLGQHFLTDGAILSKIVAAAEITAADTVLEVGPGRGALTARLVQHAGQVVAVELDDTLADALPGRLDNPPNLSVVKADARFLDMQSLLSSVPSYKVVANLPYYAASPIVRHFLESEFPPVLMVVMLQREVAQSLTARPGSMGLLSVATQYYATTRLVCHAPPRAFRPPPKVSSSVVRLDIRPEPAVQVSNAQTFFDLVRAGFSAPRKQLRNSLGHGLGLTGTDTSTLLEAVGVDSKRRAETLSLEEWAEIFRTWEKLSPLATASLRQD